MRRTMCGLVLMLLSTSAAFAQTQAPTTVQLPTFSFFTVQTSVLVPDGGGAYLGGLSSGRSGSSTRGVPGLGLGNRGIAGANQGGGMSVHATIIDHAELDAQVLASAAGNRHEPYRGLVYAPSNAPAAAVSAPPLPAAHVGALGVAEIRQQRAAEAAAQDAGKSAEAREFFAKAAGHERDGQLGLAKIYYRMAAARSQGELRAESLARIAALEGKSSARLVNDGK